MPRYILSIGAIRILLLDDIIGKTILSQFLAGPQTSQKCSISKVKTEESRDFRASGWGGGEGCID